MRRIHRWPFGQIQHRAQTTLPFLLGLLLVALCLAGCGFEPAQSEADPDARTHGRREHRPGAGSRGGFPMAGGFGSEGGDAGFSNAIPVEAVTVARRSISQFLETNGTLEAENEVDIVSRISGPVVELLTEEGQAVREGQVLARIDDQEIRAQLAIAQVNLEDARLALERARVSLANELISQELFDQARSRFESMNAQLESSRIQLSYTEIRAPFDGLIVERDVKFAQHLAPNSRLFRISDFDPLLCPIQVPEKDLPRLRRGQPSYLSVEAFPDERFQASVLRISPVVDAATGTVKVTLEVDGQSKLRPGMFASVFLETDRRQRTLVIPKMALVLESIGDTVYVMKDGTANRREVRLGYSEADQVEVLEGLKEGEQVIVIGQDSVSDGTPVYLLKEPTRTTSRPTREEDPAAGPSPAAGSRERQASTESLAGPSPSSPGSATPGPGSDASRGARRPSGFPGQGRGMPDFSKMTADELEQVKERMRGRGLSDEEIETRLRQLRERFAREPRP